MAGSLVVELVAGVSDEVVVVSVDLVELSVTFSEVESADALVVS